MNKQIKSRRNFFSKMLATGVGGASLLASTANAKGKASLTEAQKDELFFIYEEEKLARDVYITLGKLYPDENTFSSIQLSEQRHIDAAQGLCETYNIDISEVKEDEVGYFVSPLLQTLYDDLVSQGTESHYDALEVGVFIEELDIGDLTDLIEEKGMPSDVVNVYENLREGSYNHLEAFQGAISSVTA